MKFKIFKLLKFPKFPKIRLKVAEMLIHSLVAGCALFIGLATEGIESEIELLIFAVLSIFFFSHALLAIPYLFKRAFWTYIGRSIIFVLGIFAFGTASGGEPEEVIPSIILVFIMSWAYGAIRLLIINQLKSYAFTANTKTAELDLLKSQINPHFIFNSLNMLYATALEENSAKTAESIAKMSSLIRYMVEDNTHRFISVHKEAKYLQDYIKLQLMRSSVEHDIDLHIDISEEQSIAPMLLVPFVENAFKHGINPNEASTLFLNFTSNAKGVYFQLINSIDESYVPSDFEKGFGIGISNVEKRLQLMYPRKYKLSVGRENQVFSVELDIKL